MQRFTSRIDLRKLSARRTVWYAMHVPGSARHDGIPHAMMCCVDFRGLRRFRHDACRRCIFRVRRRFRHDASRRCCILRVRGSFSLQSFGARQVRRSTRSSVSFFYKIINTFERLESHTAYSSKVAFESSSPPRRRSAGTGAHTRHHS